MQYLKTGGRLYDPRLGQYSIRASMIVIATELIPLSAIHSLFREWLCGKPASGFERILCGVLVKELKEIMDRCTGQSDEIEYNVEKGVKHHAIYQSFMHACYIVFCFSAADKLYLGSQFLPLSHESSRYVTEFE